MLQRAHIIWFSSFACENWWTALLLQNISKRRKKFVLLLTLNNSSSCAWLPKVGVLVPHDKSWVDLSFNSVVRVSVNMVRWHTELLLPRSWTFFCWACHHLWSEAAFLYPSLHADVHLRNAVQPQSSDHWVLVMSESLINMNMCGN